MRALIRMAVAVLLIAAWLISLATDPFGGWQDAGSPLSWLLEWF
jgi:hypothetical protein